MARKKKHPEHVNHERWLISYADFITLLFAFFVVMFAVSQVDSKKMGRFTESFSKAVGIDMFPESGKTLLPGAIDAIPSDDPKPTSANLPVELNELRATLDQLSKKGILPPGMLFIERRNELVVRLSENVVFSSGEADVAERHLPAIVALAHELRSHGIELRIEGHTDDRPIHTARYRSNWELSTARSTAVVRVFAAEGIEARRLSAAGYGEFHPISANDTDDGRRQNRRVDIVITSTTIDADAGALPAPAPAPAASTPGDAGTPPPRAHRTAHH